MTQVDVYPSDNLRWALIDFAKKGNIKIYCKRSRRFINKILVDEIEGSFSGEVKIMRKDFSEIFYELRWANSY